MRPTDGQQAVARTILADLLERPVRYGPRTYPCQCGAGRHEHTGPRMGGRCARTGCGRYRHDPVDALVHDALLADRNNVTDDLRAVEAENNTYRRTRPSEGTVRLSASDAGTCRRAVQYRERPPADLYRSPSDKSAAMIGGVIHDGVRAVRERLYPWRLYEHDVHIDGLGTSRLDMFDPLTGRLDDTKTCSDGSYTFALRWGGRESHWKQAAMYALALTGQGHTVRTLQITYVHREKGWSQTFEHPYDQVYAQAAVAALTTLATLIEHGVEQPRDEGGPTVSALCRDWCEFRDYCWDVPGAHKASRSPRSWTMLGPDPDASGVERALEVYSAAQHAESAAKKDKAAAKDTLDGIAPKRYGDMEYRLSPTSRADTDAYIALIRRWGETDPAIRGPFEDIIMPRTEGVSVKIGPVSKAILATEARNRRLAAQAAAEALQPPT